MVVVVMDWEELGAQRSHDTKATLEQQTRALAFLVFGLLAFAAPVLAFGWSGLFWVGMGLAALFLLWCIYELILIGVQAWDERGR